MPDSFTTTLGLIKPEVGASRDSWGSKTNLNWDTVDDYISVAMPVGTVVDFAGPQAPQGWLICDGRAVSRITYSALYAVLGNAWGAGDGSTTFNLPNPNGRAAVGPGVVTDQAGHQRTFTFGSQGLGYIWNVITQAALPNYVLTTSTVGNHFHGGITGNAGTHNHTTDAQGVHGHPGSWAQDHAHTGYTDAQGSHQHTLPGSAGTGGETSAFLSTGRTANITTDIAGSHSHNVQTYASGTLALAIADNGTHAHNISTVGDHAHLIAADGNHNHTVLLGGSGQLFELQNPVIVFTKIIHAGQQAVTRAATDAVATTTEASELAELRDQIEQLRSLVFARRPQRHMSAPSRGVH